jgi:hypothetical protein
MTIGEVIKNLQGYDPETPCAYDLWLPADVLMLAKDFTDEQVDNVLYSMEHNKDASVGLSWDILELYIDEEREAMKAEE